jgi:hypothetical protein
MHSMKQILEVLHRTSMTDTGIYIVQLRGKDWPYQGHVNNRDAASRQAEDESFSTIFTTVRIDNHVKQDARRGGDGTYKSKTHGSHIF